MKDKSKTGKSLIVVGGGAAGFFCAVNAARLAPGLRVIILEKTGKLLSKVRVSGGGRCNVTHACYDIEKMSLQYPRGRHFVKKSFHEFFTNDTIRWFEERGVKLKTEPDGRIFPVTDLSSTIINCLMKEASDFGVEIMYNEEVHEICFKEAYFILKTTNGKVHKTDYLCIASGGYPKTAMFRWLKETGHAIEEPVPSLFTFNLPGHPISALMGISLEHARIKIASTRLQEEGPMLITHWGLSGPAVLKLSAKGARELNKLNYDFSISVNWLPELTDQELRSQMQEFRKNIPQQKVFNKNPFGLPARLWEFLCSQAAVMPELRWADLPSAVMNKLINCISNYECRVKGKTTFKEEFVTAGGIKLNEVDAHTMMSRKIPDLYFAGEVLDVDGITGGFNFQHAWTSGWVAARSVAHRFNECIRMEII